MVRVAGLNAGLFLYFCVYFVNFRWIVLLNFIREEPLYGTVNKVIIIQLLLLL